jgi:DNA invertase Pin-like site-specific DNA recombinase
VLTLIKRGIRVITTSGDDLTDTTDPSRIMMRQFAGSLAEYEKRRLVRKLREARERSGKLGGRKSYAEARPDTVALAKQFHADGLSYRKIAAELAARGHVTGSGKPHAASAVQKMVYAGNWTSPDHRRASHRRANTARRDARGGKFGASLGAEAVVSPGDLAHGRTASPW